MTTAGIVPATLVTGPPRLPVPYGLFTVAPPRSGSDHWQGGGVQWETLTCDTLGGVSMVQCDETQMTGLPKDLAKMPVDPGEANPFSVYGHYTCSPIAMSWEEMYNLAEQHLTTREEQQVEQTLWTGDLGNVPNFSGANGYPAPNDVTPATGTVDVWTAIAVLEQQFPDVYGSLGVLHMSRGNAARAIEQQLLQTKGGRLSTWLGTPVVAGVGYGGGKIVASSQLFTYRSDVFPGNLGGDTLNTSTNDYTALAERTYLVGFDPCGLSSVTLSA